jgi:2-dehydropantoate 2-reductase
MRHGILGPGGIGGLIAAVLADAGEDVMLIVRPGTQQLYPREILLESPFRNIRAPVSVTSSPKERLDILWVTVKATQLNAALEALPQDLQVRLVVPLLNGIDHVNQLRARFGGDSVVPATIAVESERTAPGKIAHRSPFIRFGVTRNGWERLAPALDIFRRFGFECLSVDDEPTLLWGKLVFLAPIALSTAAAGSAIGAVLSDPQKAAQLEACLREACEVATRAAAKVDANAVLAKINSLPPNMRSSMEKDVMNGNPPELDAIAGPILRGGKTYGIPVPATSELVRTLQKHLVS